jgi:hypothetical protein
VPGRSVVDQSEIIRSAEADPDYTVRPHARSAQGNKRLLKSATAFSRLGSCALQLSCRNTGRSARECRAFIAPSFTVILDSLLPLRGLRLSVVALFIFAIAIILGMYGVQLAKLSTRSELSAKVSALDSEINALKAKLDLRTRKVAQ